LFRVLLYNSPILGAQFEQTAPPISSLPTSGFLQPMQVNVFLANFIRPPMEGAATEIERVWSPASRELAFVSPRIGSKILPRGLESWLSR